MRSAITSTVGDDIRVLELVGDTDLIVRDDLEVAIRRALRRRNDLIVDVSAVTFIDAAVVRILIGAYHESSAQGSRFVLQSGTMGVVERVLRLTGVAGIVPCTRTRDEAEELISVRTNRTGTAIEPLRAAWAAT